MEPIQIHSDRIEVRIDVDRAQSSAFYPMLIRLGQLCRASGIRKVLYVRSGHGTDPLVVTQMVQTMGDLGFAGCRIAVVVPTTDISYSLLYLEQIALKVGARLRITDDIDEAERFLSDQCRELEAARGWFHAARSRAAAVATSPVFFRRRMAANRPASRRA